ncbi:uncharacterized protein TNCV_4987021 [Trichonephila clavipes]|nr:uncharacterized protein TNCV_4987021 [Trichonephila clavipes]
MKSRERSSDNSRSGKLATSVSDEHIEKPVIYPHLSTIGHVWDIIGIQLQHHPQPALNIPVLTQQQSWNSIPRSDIRPLNDTMQAHLQTCIENSGGNTGY